jgi:hypothetical protein
LWVSERHFRPSRPKRSLILEFSTTRELSIRRKMGRSRSSRTAAAVSGEPRCPRNDRSTDIDCPVPMQHVANCQHGKTVNQQ